MTDEEKKAIEKLNDFMFRKGHLPDFVDKIIENDVISSIDVVLNLIQKQEKEIEKKDKIIDLMAEVLVKVPENEDNLIIAQAINYNLEEKKERVKQYFERKVENGR
jgi:Na+-transporting NADH:ubiquinone oxidoreductase subunit NqrC